MPAAAADGIQVLIDADNIGPQRIGVVLAALDGTPARVTVSGSRGSLRRTTWPEGTVCLVAAGWQRADLALATAYRFDDQPLLVVSGDGDFALLATRHRGPVLVVSGAPSYRLRDGTTVTDPVVDGPQRLRDWLTAVGFGAA